MTEQSCARCGASMKLYRAGARYCSGACRVAAHRERKRAAVPVLPAVMMGSARWVRHDALKAPVRADNGWYASSTNPATWTTYEAAVGSRHGVGLGWVLGEGCTSSCRWSRGVARRSGPAGAGWRRTRRTRAATSPSLGAGKVTDGPAPSMVCLL